MMIRKTMRGNRTILIADIAAMGSLAGQLADILTGRDAVALTGDLGTGKTTFTQLVGRALGIAEPMTSPTFTLIQEYRLPGLQVVHGDLYRLEADEMGRIVPELEACAADPNTLLLLEWADKAPELDSLWTWRLDFAAVPQSETARQVAIETMEADKLAKLGTAPNHA